MYCLYWPPHVLSLMASRNGHLMYCLYWPPVLATSSSRPRLASIRCFLATFCTVSSGLLYWPRPGKDGDWPVSGLYWPPSVLSVLASFTGHLLVKTKTGHWPVSGLYWPPPVLSVQASFTGHFLVKTETGQYQVCTGHPLYCL